MNEMQQIKPSKQFWMVLADDGNSVTKRHESEESAMQESIRLVMKENKKFYVLKCIGAMHPVINALYGKFEDK